MQKKIHISAGIDIEEIIWGINRLPYEEITDFILRLDIAMADYDFTQNLVNKLQKALDAEQD